MNAKLISTFMLCLVILTLDVRISVASQYINYLMITERNLRITSGAVCDYQIQEGTFPADIIGLSENLDVFPSAGDYFAREQSIDKNFDLLYYYSFLFFIFLLAVLLRLIKKISTAFFIVVVIFNGIIFLMMTHPLHLEYPIRYISSFCPNKLYPYAAFDGVSLKCDVQDGDIFTYGITKDNNAILLSQGPDFTTPFTKEQIADIDTSQFLDEVVTYSPTNGI